jgi:hypothetical protein
MKVYKIYVSAGDAGKLDVEARGDTTIDQFLGAVGRSLGCPGPAGFTIGGNSAWGPKVTMDSLRLEPGSGVTATIRTLSLPGTVADVDELDGPPGPGVGWPRVDTSWVDMKRWEAARPVPTKPAGPSRLFISGHVTDGKGETRKVCLAEGVDEDPSPKALYALMVGALEKAAPVPFGRGTLYAPTRGGGWRRLYCDRYDSWEGASSARGRKTPLMVKGVCIAQAFYIYRLDPYEGKGTSADVHVRVVSNEDCLLVEHRYGNVLP